MLGPRNVGAGLAGRLTLPGSIAVAVVVAVIDGSGVGAGAAVMVALGNALVMPGALVAPSSCDRTTVQVIPTAKIKRPATM